MEFSRDSGGDFSNEKLDKNLCLNSEVMLTLGEVSSASTAFSMISFDSWAKLFQMT